MLNWETILSSPICEVRFAGFKSNTLALQRAGWSLSMERLPAFDGVRLAMKHEGARLLALSRPAPLELMHWLRGMPLEEVLGFDIVWAGSSARFEIIPTAGPLNFRAIDAVPEFTKAESVDFEQAIPFRTVSADAPEIVVAPQSVPELMEIILKLQDPTQREIRERRRKEAWRQGGPGSVPSAGYNAASDIRAQIITLAG